MEPPFTRWPRGDRAAAKLRQVCWSRTRKGDLGTGLQGRDVDAPPPMSRSLMETAFTSQRPASVCPRVRGGAQGARHTRLHVEHCARRGPSPRVPSDPPGTQGSEDAPRSTQTSDHAVSSMLPIARASQRPVLARNGRAGHDVDADSAPPPEGESGVGGNAVYSYVAGPAVTGRFAPAATRRRPGVTTRWTLTPLLRGPGRPRRRPQPMLGKSRLSLANSSSRMAATAREV